MRPQSKFGHRHVWAVAVAVFLFSTTVCAAPAARVEFAIGSVTAEAADGRVRTLQKGAVVEEGEIVNTNEGRAQLRFTDDAFVSLHSETVFRIEEYRWSGVTDGSERGFFRLVKGGLRTITGKLAKINKKAYRMSTTVATIGIRGTDYTMQLNGELSGSVADGEIEVCNAGGCLAVAPGQSYYVPDANSKPIFSNKQTSLAPLQPRSEGSTVRATDSDAAPLPGGLGLRMDDPTTTTGNLLNTTTGRLVSTLDVATRGLANTLDLTSSELVNIRDVKASNLFGTLDKTTNELIRFTQGTADSLIGGAALNLPRQDVTGAVNSAFGGTTSTLNSANGGLIDKTGAVIDRITGINPLLPIKLVP